MGIGICSWGSHIPIYRMDRRIFADTWGTSKAFGERSVANNDEDSITMAVASLFNLSKQFDRSNIDALYFASSTCPYLEKMNSTIIAAAADLDTEICTLDLTNSLRAGTSALKAAFDGLKSDKPKNILVTAADCRIAYPRSPEEQTIGDGAASILVGNRDNALTLIGSYSLSNEIMDVWRKPADQYIRTWEPRFIMNEGFRKVMKKSISNLLSKYNVSLRHVAKVILCAPNSAFHKVLIKDLQLEDPKQIQDPLLANVGYCGVAHAFLMLIAAIEDSKPGDVLLLANYADGADTFLFQVNNSICKSECSNDLKRQISTKIMMSSYARYLSYKNIIETVPGEPFRLFPSASVTYRERDSIIRCHGSKCRKCGTVTFPIQTICYNCSAKDSYESVSLAEMKGNVFTFSLDNLAGRSDDPVVVQTVAEMGESKVRFYGMMTDCIPSEVKIGLPVRLSFRRIYEGAGMYNYFWKCKPIIN